MSPRSISLPPDAPYRLLVGVGGIGTGLVFALQGNHTLGRNESRLAHLLDVRDYCKLHIIAHYVAVLLGARPQGGPFRVIPVGKVGADEPGGRLRREMADAGMDTHHVELVQGRPTLFSACFQYPNGDGGNLTTDNAAAFALTDADVERAAVYLTEHREHSMVLVAPEAPLDVRRRLLEIATQYGALRVASFASAEIREAHQLGLLEMVDLLAANEDEAAALVGKPYREPERLHFLEAYAMALASIQPRMCLVLTVGKGGAYGWQEGMWQHCPAPVVPVVATAGAGDALLGGVIACLAAGVPFICPSSARAKIQQQPLESALDFGVLLASLTVTSPHTIDPRANVESLCAFADEIGVRWSEELWHLLL